MKTAEKATINVSGMTCAACQARVQRTLEKTPGVENAAVNLMTATASVAYDPAQVDMDALLERIRSTGYGAESRDAAASAIEEQESQERAREEEFREVRNKAIVALAAGVLAMGTMPFMHGGDHSGMSMGISLVNVALFVLTTAVMVWAGRHFYTRALAAVRHHSADM